MEKEFVPYDIALALKELGFGEKCISAYRNEDGEEQLLPLGNWINSDTSGYTKDFCTAPLYQQAFRWFREKHHTTSYIYFNFDDMWCFSIDDITLDEGYKTYEEAELACLKKLIEIVKTK